MSLHAITRLDVSNNDLTDIPSSVLQMQSLKQLNLSKNKLEQLPAPLMMPKSSLRRGNKNTSVENFGGGGVYNCPWLEEMQLQDNRLEFLPPSVFSSLKSLVTLDVSNNKLQFLPVEMWKNTKLKVIYNAVTRVARNRGNTIFEKFYLQKIKLLIVS